ncbi:MAG: type 4a pilus biogenesis protein PilO [Pontibacterium sp.]
MNRESLNNAFKGFDINDLDFSTAGSWPVGVKVISYLLLLGAILAAGIHFYVADKTGRLDREMRKETELKQIYERKAFEVANLDALRKQMADVEGRFAEMLLQLPTQNEVPGLLDDITNIGRDSGLEIRLIDLQAEKKNKFYIELPIKITVGGTYHQMGEFVSGVSAIPRIVTLHDYKIVPADNGRLIMNISANTYRYDDAQ